MPHRIHIGKVIKELVKIRRVSVLDFADKINCTPRNVYKIFSKSSLDSALLAKISKVLGQNLFFYYLTDEEILEYKNNTHNEEGLLNSVSDVESTLLHLKTIRKDKSKK